MAQPRLRLDGRSQRSHPAPRQTRGGKLRVHPRLREPPGVQSHARHAKLLPYEEASSIPLYIRAPGIRAGTTIETPVSVIDFAPTLLGLAGAPPSLRKVGRNLAPAILQGVALTQQPVLLEGFMHLEDCQRRSIVTDRYKLTLVVTEHAEPDQYNLTNQLFDLKEDPYELKKLHHDPAHQELVKELTALRTKTAARTGDLFPAMSAPAPCNPPV